MKTVVNFTLIAVLISFATPAAAYVGPGAGLSLLGALWGLLTAVFAALAFVVVWPFRRLFGRKRKQRVQDSPQAREQARPATAEDHQKPSSDARPPR